MSSAEFNSWVKDESNGLVMTRTMDDLEYSVTYLPAASLVLRDHIQPANKSDWDSAIASKKDVYCFILKYKLHRSNADVLKFNLENENDYYSRSNYLAFGLDKDVWLECDSAQIPCTLHQFIPHYGISPEAEVLITFPKPSESTEQSFTFVLNDKIYDAGLMKFEFDSDNLNNIPTIQ